MVDGLEVRGRELVVRSLDRCPVMKDYNALCLTCRLETAVEIELHKSDPSPVALCCSLSLSCHFRKWRILFLHYRKPIRGWQTRMKGATNASTGSSPGEVLERDSCFSSIRTVVSRSSWPLACIFPTESVNAAEWLQRSFNVRPRSAIRGE